MSKFDVPLSQIKMLEKQALIAVLDHYGGAKPMADALGVTEGSVRRSMTNGVLGRYLAYQVSIDPSSPFSLSDLRADYKDVEKQAPMSRPGPQPGVYEKKGAERRKKS